MSSYTHIYRVKASSSLEAEMLAVDTIRNWITDNNYYDVLGSISEDGINHTLDTSYSLYNLHNDLCDTIYSDMYPITDFSVHTLIRDITTLLINSLLHKTLYEIAQPMENIFILKTIAHELSIRKGLPERSQFRLDTHEFNMGQYNEPGLTFIGEYGSTIFYVLISMHS